MWMGVWLVARRRGQRLTRGGHNVTGQWRGVLGQHGGRGLVHGRRLRVLAGALPTQCHLVELGRQLVSLEESRIMLVLVGRD